MESRFLAVVDRRFATREGMYIEVPRYTRQLRYHPIPVQWESLTFYRPLYDAMCKGFIAQYKQASCKCLLSYVYKEGLRENAPLVLVLPVYTREEFLVARRAVIRPGPSPRAYRYAGHAWHAGNMEACGSLSLDGHFYLDL